MTSKGKGVLWAAAPISVLLLLAAGARFLPAVTGKEATGDERITAPPAAGGRSGAKAERKRAPAFKPPVEKPADTKTQAVLQKVVNGQLDAFARDDYGAALSYSTPEFRGSTTPDSFRQLVATGYATLIKPKKVRFAPARCSADRAMMPVFLKSEGGREGGYLYILRKQEKQGDAEVPWCIEGVVPVSPQGNPEDDAPAVGRMTDVRDV